MLALWVILSIIGVTLVGLVTLWLIAERGHITGLPATRAAMKGEGAATSGGLSFETLHGFLYGAFIYKYLDFSINQLMHRMGPKFKQRWADHYHGKVMPLELAEAIINLDMDIPRMDLEQVIPYTKARDIVLNGSPRVVLLDCPCRAARENPCTPTQVCMVIGNGDFAMDHHPDKTRVIDQQEAITLLRDEHERGHVHTAYFKDACDNKFYAICNCCPCCCGGLESMMKYDVPMVAASGFVAEVDDVMCSACGMCEDICPFDAITVEDVASVAFDSCMGCGVCEGHCDNDAIHLVKDTRKGYPLDVRELVPLA